MSDVLNTNELIVAKLRKVAKQAEWYQALDPKLLTAAADALEAATRVPVQGERELAAEAWAIRNEFLAFWGHHSANDLAAVGYSPRMPETPILDTWHPRDGSGEAVQGEPNQNETKSGQNLVSGAPSEAQWDFGSSCLWCDPDHRGPSYSEFKHGQRHALLAAGVAPQEPVGGEN